jgi:hypothetical protein
MKSILRLFIPLFLLAMLAPAWAQYTNSYGYSFNNPISASCNSMFWDKMNSRLVYRVMLKKKGYTNAQLNQISTEQMLAALGGAAQARSAAKAPVSGAATKFSPAGKSLLLPAMVNSMVNDREQQKALLEVFEQGLKAYEKEAASSGFQNDVAGAMVFLIGACYYVFNNGLEPNSDGTEIIARALQQNLDTPAFRQIADADKQKFYELMVGLGTYLGLAYQQAVADNDAAQAETLKDAAADALKGFLKLDPATVRITANGLEIAK